MTHLTCPKCRQGVPDDALDVGQCPACGYPLDGPVVLTGVRPRTGQMRLFLALGMVTLLAGAGIAGYLHFAPATPSSPHTEPEVALLGSQQSTPLRIYIAPFPHEPRARESIGVSPEVQSNPGEKLQPKPMDVVIPKEEDPHPVGVVMKVDPKIAPVRKFDQPDDTATLPDLNSGDRVVLTGKLRGLRIGSVNGKASLDASGLVVEEIIITGDLNSQAVVQLNAPNGKVTIGGYVAGSSKLTVVATGGDVLIANSARVTGGATVTITAKRMEAKGPLTGGAKVNITLNSGGLLKLTRLEEGAIVTYRKSAPNDPLPRVESGEIRGGAKVVLAK